MANVENETLQYAINNAAVGETLVLTNDITLTSRVNVSNVVTIDLNGHIIKGDIDDGYGAIYVGTKGVLTIKDMREIYQSLQMPMHFDKLLCFPHFCLKLMKKNTRWLIYIQLFWMCAFKIN